MKKSSITKSSLKKSELKKSSKLTSWPKNAAERRKLYDKYRSGHENLSYQFLEMMVKGEDIFKGITKPVIKRAYIKADEIGSSKNEGLITRKEFPFFLKYLLYFTDLFKAFTKIDEDKNKKLTLDEFIKNRSVLEAKMSKERAEELFKTMDKDGGGSISFDEFCNWALEQPNFLNYNNLEYFKVENTDNYNDDEDPDENLPEIPEIKLKTQESEEFKEDFDSTPQNIVQNIEEINKIDDSELMALKNEIIKLKMENQELIAKLFKVGSSKVEKNQENVMEDKSETNKKINELTGEGDQNDEINKAGKIELEEQTKKENDDMKKLEEIERTQKENELKSEIESKIAEIQILQDKNNELIIKEAKALEEAKERESLLQQELETKNNQIESNNKEKNLLEKRIDELAEVQLKAEQQEILLEQMKNQIEESNKEKNSLEGLLEKTKQENENQLNTINNLLSDCEGRCLKFQESLNVQESKLKEEFLKMEEELKSQLSKQSAEYEEKIANHIETNKKLQEISNEDKKQLEIISFEHEEKISFHKKTQNELQNKIETLEKMIQSDNSEDLKSQLLDLETKISQENSIRQDLEIKKNNLENELQELKLNFQKIELEKENMKKNHIEEINNLSSLQNDLEEKMKRIEQNNLEKQALQEKEFKFKLEEFDQKEEKTKFNFEARIQQLENERQLDKILILDQEKVITQLRNQNETQIKSLNDKEILLKEHEEILKKCDNMKKEGNSELIIKEQEQKIKDLIKELENNKLKNEENEKKAEEIKIKYELEIKEKTVNYESIIHQEKEKFLKIEKDFDQLNKHLIVVQNESSELKKELKSHQMFKKGLEIENAKISENKNKEEIYVIVDENKSNQEPLLNNGEKNVAILKKDLRKLKIIIIIISLLAFAMLLVAILK